MNFDLLVEGPTDEALGRRLLTATGHTSGICFGRRGCAFIQQSIQGYAQRARYGSPLFAMADFMDFEHNCAPSLATALIPDKPELMILSVVVRELESWILADRQGVADLLRVSVALVPHNPEMLPDPKRSLIDLARRSRRTHIREAFVPQPGTSASTGPGYALEVQRFVAGSWDFNRARELSPSLNRCLERLQAIDQDQ
jgi:hypothetical protein